MSVPWFNGARALPYLRRAHFLQQAARRASDKFKIGLVSATEQNRLGCDDRDEPLVAGRRAVLSLFDV